MKNIRKLNFVITFIFGCFISYAQYSITGPQSVSQGETHTYSVTPTNFNSVNWYTVGTTGSNSSFTVTFINLNMNIVAAMITDYYGNTSQVYINISIQPTSETSQAPTPTILSSTCGSIVLTRTDPPSGSNLTYYWQDTANGMSTSNAASTITKTSSGVQYLRARHSSGVWASTYSSLSYTVGEQINWYQDLDGDGLGDPDNFIFTCNPPTGYVTNNSDSVCPLSYGLLENGGCPIFELNEDENYVYMITPRVKSKNLPYNGVYENLYPQIPTKDMVEDVTYFDGLGRPKQKIGIRAGGNSEDIITPIAYDDYGRQKQHFLPYAEVTNLGFYRDNANTEILDYYYNNPKFIEDFSGMTLQTINPYSEKEFDDSPLNIVMKQAAPGEDWALGNGNEIEFVHDTNIASEVRYYDVSLSFANNTYTPTLTGGTTYYSAGELYKTVTKDANHDGTSSKAHTTEEFKDKLGRVVLKRTYGASDINMDGDTNDAGEALATHDTYYVYDDYGNLSYVLPPKSEPQTAKPDATELSELCYQYKYDHRNRLVEKKVPGKGLEYIIYDALDRPVITQDANLRELGKWAFTAYDVFNRTAYTGLVYRPSWSRATMQNHVDTGSYKLNVQMYSSSPAINGVTIYYPKNFLNTTYIPESSIDILTINYYDNYTFDKVNGNSETSYSITPITNAKGLVTGSKVRVLGTSHWITTVSYYDDKSRPIYAYSYNSQFGTTDKVKSKLDFTGLVEETTTTHARSGYSTITTVDTYTYDHQGRLLTQTNKINSLPKELIVVNEYDGLGQLVSKKVGGGVAGNVESSIGLQTVDYTYNIRGWLKQINNPASLGGDLFGFKINYNTVSHSGTELYNGNIAETEWKTQNDNVLRWYRYSYDGLNRITSGIASSSNYNLTSVGYDKNGNITNLIRQGVRTMSGSTVTSYGEMDNLTYDYQAYSNKLLKVSDASTLDQYGFNDDAVNATADNVNDYTYDTNGNMLTDSNKGITTNISYNHLNLPTYVALGGGNISYIYDATGAKLKKTVSTGTTVEYAGNYVYENGSLKFFNHPEGYVDAENGYKYVYQYKDHLGNIRLSYKKGTSGLEILEENNYYPFGLKHKGYNYNVNSTNLALKYKFGGKEYQDELGLNWYDITARNYDPALGRWMSIDPLAEQMRRHSPYNYAFNNPIYFIDPDGMEPLDWIKNLETGKYEWNNSVTGWENTPDNYLYIGKSNHSVVQDLFGEKTVFNTPSSDKGSIGFNDFETAHAKGYGIDNVATDSNMQISLRADVSEGIDYNTGEICKDFNGVVVDVVISGQVRSATTPEGQALTLKPLEMTANGVQLTNTSNLDEGTTFRQTGSTSFRGFLSAESIQGIQGKGSYNFSFKGLYSDIDSGSYLKGFGATGFTLMPNNTYMSKEIQFNNFTGVRIKD